MYANATLELERKDNVLTIPLQAVIRNGIQSTVLVVNSQNHVESRNVQLGIQGSVLIEVTSGLNDGDRVITGGQSKYQAGQAVKPLLQQLPASDTGAEQGEGEQ
jgi:multidrug efflux pump subunit AcrA (membrane-fusion protein)